MTREANWILLTVIGLVLVGVLAVYSASAADSAAHSRLLRELVYVALGAVGMFVAAHFDYNQLRSAFLFRVVVVVAVLLLIAVLVPGLGDVRKGAQRWLEIGAFSFQPSELAKFALVVLLAVKLASNQDVIKTFWKGYVPAVIITAAFCGLVLLQKDLGTPVVMATVAFVMMFVGGVRLLWLIPSIFPVAGLVYFLSVTSPHRLRRLTAFLDPWQYQSDEGYQLIQSMTAFAQGGIWGRGPGASEQKLHYLPEPHTDFIFAVWAEETGLIGTLAVMGLFVALLVVSLRVAMHAKDLFGTLLVIGIASLVCVQAGVNMGVATGILPTKGLPLPFISWGGTSLLVFMTMMGVVINVALQAESPNRNRTLMVVPA